MTELTERMKEIQGTYGDVINQSGEGIRIGFFSYNRGHLKIGGQGIPNQWIMTIDPEKHRVLINDYYKNEDIKKLIKELKH